VLSFLEAKDTSKRAVVWLVAPQKKAGNVGIQEAMGQGRVGGFWFVQSKRGRLLPSFLRMPFCLSQKMTMVEVSPGWGMTF